MQVESVPTIINSLAKHMLRGPKQCYNMSGGAIIYSIRELRSDILMKKKNDFTDYERRRKEL